MTNEPISLREQAIRVSDVIAEIKSQLRVTQQVVIGEPRLELSEVILSVGTVITRSLDGKIEVGVPTLGMSVAAGGRSMRQHTQQVTLTLEPPEPVITQASTEWGDLDMAAAIIAMRRELQKGLSEEPRLLPKSLEINVAFAAERMVNAGGKVKLVFIQFDPSAEFGEAVTNTVTLKFIAPQLPV